MSKINYILRDTFNNKQLSQHRTIKAAINARDRHLRAIRKANGRNAYLTYAIQLANGEPIDKDELDREEWYAYQEQYQNAKGGE